MKAIVLKKYGSPDGLELREVERPLVRDDGVLLKVRAASVNAADWHLIRTLPPFVGRLLRMSGSVRGIDVAGQVEAVGRNVTRVRPGDEVFGAAIGAFAEYAATREDRLAPKPRNLSFGQAATLPVAGCTALQGLRDFGGVQAGQRVLIYGAGGGVGTFAVQIAKALGAQVTAVTRTDNVDLVRSLGADEVIDYTTLDFTTRGQLYDVLFDIGADRSLADYRRVLAPGGRLVFVGAPPELLKAVWRLLRSQLMPRFRSRGIAFVARERLDDLVALKELAEAGKLTPVIDRQFPLREAPDAIRYLGAGHARGKIVIDID